ncbi:MAG TPA: diguanylate cyclase [Burkholderiales bacterium]|nr:diguanylate cyclase [Burkholderiales bacterium]
MRVPRKYRELGLVAAAALLSTWLAQSSLVSGISAFLIGALGPALLPTLLLYRRQGRRRSTYAFFQRMIDNLPDAFFVKDAGGRYVMVNKAFTRERGCAPEDIVGKTSQEVLGAGAQESIAEDRAALRGEPFSKEEVARDPVMGGEYFRMVTKRRVENEYGVPLVIGYHLDITRWKLAQRDLQAALELQKSSSERTRQFAQRLLDAVPMPVYVKDAESRYLIVNATQTRESQRPAEEMIGLTSMSLVPNEEIARVMREEDLAVLDGGSVYKEEENYHPVTGKGRFRVVTKSLCRDAEGAPVIVCTMFDTTAWRHAERDLKVVLERETELRKRTQTFVQRLIDVIPDPFYVKTAEGRFIIVNEAYAREKQDSTDELVGFDSYVLEPEDAAEGLRREDREVIAGAQVDKEEHRVTPGPGGERFHQVVKRRSEYVDGSPVVVGAHFDITRWKIAERELERVAYQDSLTGLANRRYFLAEAERAAAGADRHGQALSLLLFDLDHFKRVNDRHGHQAGDDVLCRVAERTRNSLRTEDMPARWGGEEFVALLPLTALPEAMLVANRLRNAVAATPTPTCAGALPVTCSCGVAQRRRAEPIAELIARADAALYKAKDSGRNACVAAPLD